MSSREDLAWESRFSRATLQAVARTIGTGGVVPWESDELCAIPGLITAHEICEALTDLERREVLASDHAYTSPMLCRWFPAATRGPARFYVDGRCERIEIVALPLRKWWRLFAPMHRDELLMRSANPGPINLQIHDYELRRYGHGVGFIGPIRDPDYHRLTPSTGKVT